MKKYFFAALLVVFCFGSTASFAQKNKKKKSKKEKVEQVQVPMQNALDSLCYALGINIGKSLSDQKMDTFNFDLFFEAFETAYTADSARMTMPEATAVIQAYFQKQNQNQTHVNNATDEGAKFLSENKKKPGVTETASGLQYEVLREGTGKRPGMADTVTAHYEGRLLNGKKFDSSYDKGEPLTFSLHQVIPGWQEGIQLMKEGAKYRFYIPSNLAYGPQGFSNVIPPNSTLVFEVELVKVQ